MTRATFDNLTATANRYLADARQRGVDSLTHRTLERILTEAREAAQTYANERDRILQDPHLTDDGKRDRLQRLDGRRDHARDRLDAAREQLDFARKRHSERAVGQRRAPDADRMLARHDLDRLVAGVPIAELPDRLRFAVENAGDAVADLLLADGYAERVLLPALGPSAAGTALRWDRMKRDLIRERHPEAGEHMRALDAMPTAANAVLLTEHAIAAIMPDGVPAGDPADAASSAAAGLAGGAPATGPTA